MVVVVVVVVVAKIHNVRVLGSENVIHQHKKSVLSVVLF